MKTCCSGCSRLSEELWFSRRKISFIILGLSAPCNFKCIYCNAHDGMMIDKWKEKMKQAIELLEYYDAQGLIDGETEIQFVTGEIGVAPDRERILSILAKCRSSILSNCSVYVERIAEMLRSGRSRIVVSIDAGTRSAFQKIRGVDLFDQVRANVARYIESGNVILKYILLIGVNDDDENLKGFIDFCHEVGGFQVVLSRDTRDMGNVATERPLLSVISRFAGALQEKGITVGVRQREFTAQEYEKIQAQIPSVIGTLPRE